MSNIELIPYCENNAEEWDDFVLSRSMNGNFLQTRRFINYHKCGKFKDCSLCVRKGKELVATILANEVNDKEKMFFSHQGSTYGGITISSNIYSASMIDNVLSSLEAWLKENEFKKAYLKMVPWMYQKKNTDLIDYFLYKYGFQCYDELNYYMHLERYKDDVISQFSSSKRRDYRYSLRNNLKFRQIRTKEEIAIYYEILQKNLAKLNLPSVHTYEDLCDLKFNRFNDEIEFYSVYHKDKMIAGSMVFLFDKTVFHTQYLSSDEEYLSLYPMDFLIKNLIQNAVDRNIPLFTFGICTEDRGRYLNLGLSRFKEGFGTEFCINRSYEKYFE